MLEKSLISGFADEIDSAFDVQLGVLESLGQKYIELRAADGIGIADFTMDKAKEIKEKMDAFKEASIFFDNTFAKRIDKSQTL